MEDKTELAVNFFRGSFSPVLNFEHSDDIKTTQEIGEVLLSNGIKISHKDIIHMLNEEGFIKKYMGTDFVWLLKRV